MFLKYFLICVFQVFITSIIFGQDSGFSLYLDSNNINFEEVINKEFELLDYPSVNLGFTHDKSWLKFDLEKALGNQSRKNLVLTSKNPITDSLIVYVIYSSGKVDVQYFGSLIEEYKSINQNPMVVALNDSIEDIYLKIYSHTFIRDEFTFENSVKHQNSKIIYFTFLGMVMGVLLIMFLYNIILFLKLKEPAYLFYSLFVIGVFILNLYAEGLGNLFVWRNHPSFILCAEPMSVVLCTFGLCFYTNRVLNVNNYNSTLSLLLKFIGASSISLLIIIIVLDSQDVSLISNMLAFFTIIITFVIALIVLYKGNKQAMYFIIGWSLFMTGAMGRILYNSGVLDYHKTIHFSHHLGTILEAIVFTWMITKFLKEERELNQSQRLKIKNYISELDNLKQLLKTSLVNDSVVQTKVDIDVSSYLKVPLSKREKEVLLELSKGLTYQAIADTLFISKSTVKTHLINIYDKLSVSNRTEAINKAQILKVF